ncbi:MAG TPA: carboxypeptidase regulatory-like domain-containing protein [Xanthobacteraceae bacterium]|nr:carboxypeptidase regulatory-like domain-containing protein [Xanthobacteraceae bacterium]
MATSKLGLLALTGLTVSFLHLGSSGVEAQGASPLHGKVTSAEEPVMEGVIVSAKKDGSNVTVSVVTDDKGQYSFPAGRLDSGKYAISIRAVGYNLDGPKSVDVTGAGATADLKLVKTKNLAAQLSNAEWLLSAPGTDQQKAFLGSCVGCHTLQRVFMSTHSAEEFLEVFKRMGLYSPGSQPTRPQLIPTGGPRSQRERVHADVAKPAAEWLAANNLSGGQLSYPLKTLPRPKGKATHVIYTEWDLPRKQSQPHDVILDKDGNAWYSDFAFQFIGTLDPKTGKVTEYPLPVMKEGAPVGSLQIAQDPNGNFWLANMYQAGLIKFDPKSKQATPYPYPQEWQTPSTQSTMVAAKRADVDGKIWTNNQETHNLIRFDIATGKYEDMGRAADAAGKHINAYGIPPDIHNNIWLLEQGNTHIGLFDAKTKVAKIYATPTPNSKPRRGRVDAENRLWFAEFGGNAIGMFDPKTEKITEWKISTPYSAPYDAEVDKKGRAWTGSMNNDFVSRVDTKTGEDLEYLLPRPTNIRHVFVDNRDNPSLWVGSNHGASIVKIEPLD